MSGDPKQLDPAVHEAHDGERTGPAAESVRMSVPHRSTLDALGRLDERLRREFAAEAQAATPQTDGSRASSERTPAGRWLGLLAAAVALGAAWLWTQWYTAEPAADAGATYATLVASFEPDHVCTNNTEFVAYTHEAFGQSIGADFDGGVTLVGWTGAVYGRATALVPTARVLLASEGDIRLIAIFIPAGSPAPELVTRDDELRIHTRRLGGVTVYEVSPLEDPAVLPLLSRVSG